MECFKVIGYYICEVRDTPKWLHGISGQLLSVSGCLGEQHPGWGRDEDASREYQKRLMMQDEQYREFLETRNHLFDLRRMDVDCRFLQLSDTQYFHEKICPAIPCHVVSISTIPKYFEILEEELKGSNSHGLMSGEVDNSSWIGSDILGWDISGFHSFLCNSLQKRLPAARFNDMGLLENDFDEVTGFASEIAGLGEPVEWIPCRVGICNN